MFSHNDPLNNYLRDLGYNAVKLPRSDIKPSQLFARYSNGIQSFTELSTFFVTKNVQPPAIKENAEAASINGRHTSNINTDIGINIMGTIIQAMAGSDLGLDAAFKNAATITFQFNNVSGDAIDQGELDQFLNASPINPNAVVGRALLNENAIYVATRTLKSSEFTVQATKSDGTALSLDVPVIRQIVGGKLDVGANTTENTFNLTFKGNLPLVFGLQAVLLSYDNDRLHLLFQAASNAVVFAPGSRPAYLENSGRLLEIIN